MSAMRNLQRELFTAAQAQAIDRRAINKFGINGFALMCQAGEAAFQEMAMRWTDRKTVTVFCGGGNNGGDGYVVAKLAKEANYKVICYAVSDPQQLKNEAKLAYLQAMDANIEVVNLIETEMIDASIEGVIVDACLGIGLKGQVRGLYQRVISVINGCGNPVLSIDVPSGICADTGSILGDAVQADVTVSFIGLKRGLYTSDAKQKCGDIVFQSLGLPLEVYQHSSPAALLLDYSAPLLPCRLKNTHKNHFGHSLIVGGSAGMAGAALMSAESALVSGAGLVTVATDAANFQTIICRRPELMCIDTSLEDHVQTKLNQSNVLAIGPGLIPDKKEVALLNLALNEKKRIIVDAGGLDLLKLANLFYDHWVLTPHPGEAARLLNVTTAEVQSDRFAAVNELQARYGGVVVLKGAGTLIADSESVHVCDRGNSSMSTAGAGDVLTGVIAGLAAQGLDLREAAKLGVWAHASAGDMARNSLGKHLLATDLIPFVRQLW